MKNDKNISKNDEKILEFETKINELTIGWQRTQADFDNFRKRSEESKKSLMDYANEDLISDILPILDNFQRSAQHIPEELKQNNWALGMQFIEKQLENVLLNHGLTKIKVEPKNQFDPNFHEAIICDKCDGFKPNQITEVVENGYMLNEKVIRSAKVKVAK
jgi:molecular chaperone GrpE